MWSRYWNEFTAQSICTATSHQSYPFWAPAIQTSHCTTSAFIHGSQLLYIVLPTPPPPQSSFVLSIVTCRNHKTENANCTFLASILLDPMDNQRIYTCAATHTCPSTKGLIFPPLSMTKRYITTTNPPKEVISLISGKTLRQKIRFSIGKKLILILICLVTLYTASLYQRRYLTSISFSL